jgi:hypothetical protein
MDIREAVISLVPPLRDAQGAAVDSIFSKFAQSTVIRGLIAHAQWTMGIEHPHEFFRATELYTLKGLEGRIKCPMLMLFGEEEIASFSHAFMSNTMNFVSMLDCDRTFHVFTKREGAGTHCQVGGVSFAQAVIFEWLNDTLCRDKPQALDGKHKLVVPDEMFEIIAKYHGEEMTATLQNIQREAKV